MLALSAPATAESSHTVAVLVVAATGSADTRFANDAADQAALLRGVRIVRLDRDKTDSLVARLRRAIADVPAGDKLYLYIAGHGDVRGIRAGPASWITPLSLREALAGGRFEHALVAVEACDSGVFGRATSARVSILTASRPHENSYASGYDARTGQWLDDEFSDALVRVVRGDRTLTLVAAYGRIKRAVWSAHPQLYGAAPGFKLAAFFGT